MNDEFAKLILQGLIERAAANRKNTFLSEAEFKAVEFLIGQVRELVADDESGTEAPKDEEIFEPVVKWLPEPIVGEEPLVCIDFGTSYSKAFASEGDDPDEAPDLIDIALSPEAEGSAKYLLPSELLIHNGEVFFGRAARKLFDDIAAEQDRLIDNPKQYMTLSKDVSNLEKLALPEQKDPDHIFTERDALVLYLSHLVRMVDLSLAASDLPQSLLMRYTHPAWKKDITEQNGAAMRRIVAEAMALARCYPLDFESKLNTRRASKLLVAARQAKDKELPFDLLKEPVAEATAAGAGALMEARPASRQHYVILDIGAGTTDVTGCLCVKVRGHQAKVWEIQSARGAKNLAGNALDNALQKFILDLSSLAKGSTEYVQAERALRKTIRAEKETLFSEGAVLVELVTDELIEVMLDDFRNDPMVEKIFSAIKEMVINAAFAISEKDTKVYLVPTGGGANLSIIQAIISEQQIKGDQRLKLELTDAMPEQLKEAYPQIEPYYAQLAVSVGGAHPALPIQKPSIDSFEEDPGPMQLQPTYTSPHY